MAPSHLRHVSALALLLAALSNGAARADDGPGVPPAPVPPVTPVTPPVPGTAPAAPGPAVPGGEAPPAGEKPAVPALATPSDAWRDLNQAMQVPANRKPGFMEGRAKEYVAAWEASKQETKPGDLIALGQFLNVLNRGDGAEVLFKKAVADESLAKPQRAQAAVLVANHTTQLASQSASA